MDDNDNNDNNNGKNNQLIGKNDLLSSQVFHDF